MAQLDSALIEKLDANRDIISFPKLNMEFTLDGVAFTVGGMEIRWYGVVITIGLILAMFFGFSKMKKYGLEPDRAIDCVIGGFFGGIIGARLYYVLLNWSEFSGDLRLIFNTRTGGLAIYGGIIGALLFGVIVAKFRRVHIPTLLDIVGMSFLIGQGIGRWGNFFNHEAFGTNTDLPWGMTSGNIRAWIIDKSSYIDGDLYAKGIFVDPDQCVHPCFLYESIWCLLGFLIILAFSRKRKYDGQLFIMYVGWYGLGRFFIEGLRTDPLMIGTIRVSQALAAITFIAAVILLMVLGSRARRLGTDCVLYKDTEESKFFLEAAQKAIEEREFQKANKQLERQRKNGGDSIYSGLIPDETEAPAAPRKPDEQDEEKLPADEEKSDDEEKDDSPAEDEKQDDAGGNDDCKADDDKEENPSAESKKESHFAEIESEMKKPSSELSAEIDEVIKAAEKSDEVSRVIKVKNKKKKNK